MNEEYESPLDIGYVPEGETNRRFTRRVYREDGGVENHCALCDATLTWFTFENVWKDGQVVARVCSPPCEALPSHLR